MHSDARTAPLQQKGHSILKICLVWIALCGLLSAVSVNGGSPARAGTVPTMTAFLSQEEHARAERGRPLQLRVQDPSGDAGEILVPVQGPLRLVPLEGANMVVNGKVYHGPIEISPGKGESGLQVVAHLPLADYLASVQEVPFDWPDAALEAQAIVTRTILARRINERQGTASLAGYDICTRGADCPYYVGEEISEVPDIAAWQRAVQNTKGKILTTAGRPIQAFLHPVSGGRTRDYADIFGGTDISYLGEVESPEGDEAPFYRWQVTFSLQNLQKILSSVRKSSWGDLQSVETAKGKSGKEEVLLLFAEGKSQISVVDFQRIVNRHAPVLFPKKYPVFAETDIIQKDPSVFPRVDGEFPTLPSPQLSFTMRKDSVDVIGRGFGHTVGLSQWGARTMAAENPEVSAEDILRHYYLGISLSRSDLPGKVRVLLSDTQGKVEIMAKKQESEGRFQAEVASGDVVLTASSPWVVARGGKKSSLSLIGTERTGLGLSITGFIAPFRVRAGEAAFSEFVLTRTARVSMRVEDEDGQTVFQEDLAVLEPGRHKNRFTVEDAGRYRVFVTAKGVSGKGESGQESTKSLSFTVEPAVFGPTFLQFFVLLTLSGGLIVGSLRSRALRKRERRRFASFSKADVR